MTDQDFLAMTTQGETREALRALVAKWRKLATFDQPYGHVLSSCADELDAVLSTAEGPELDLERAFRTELWLNHGHRGIYGDDGEMQCGECLPFGCGDYKRDPLAAVVAASAQARIQRAAKAWQDHEKAQTASPSAHRERGEQE